MTTDYKNDHVARSRLIRMYNTVAWYITARYQQPLPNAFRLLEREDQMREVLPVVVADLAQYCSDNGLDLRDFLPVEETPL